VIGEPNARLRKGILNPARNKQIQENELVRKILEGVSG